MDQTATAAAPGKTKVQTPARRIEDYALIGNLRTVALVARNGAIEWLCLPRFDSAACFASMLGSRENGEWSIAPTDEPRRISRRYIAGTLVLETEFETETGTARLTDFMPVVDTGQPTRIVRIVTGLRGTVEMRFDATFRFDYGRVVPWVRRDDSRIMVIAGPDAIELQTPVDVSGVDFSTVGTFTIREGDTIPSVLTWHNSFDPVPGTGDASLLLQDTIAFWTDWSSRCKAPEEGREAVVRSAITLKALSDRRTGAVVAAATTSLPEKMGGVRNWDYRYCWLRDATFALYALMEMGYTDEAGAWRDWLERAVAGEPSHLQIMYGLAGERRLDEYTVPWLKGFGGSEPVRIGNAAHAQKQFDVYGEVADAFHVARKVGLETNTNAWSIQVALTDFLVDNWEQPCSDIWEQRTEPRHYTYSKVMMWVAFDRAVKAVERFGLDGSLDRWKESRTRIHTEICTRGFSRERNAFVQAFDEHVLDASALLLPLVGFLPASDPRIKSTVDAIQRELTSDGFVLRYETAECRDGLPPGEGAFLACSLWLADNLAMTGKIEEARALFNRVLAVCNDVGLLSEEYDPHGRMLLGNFPQAFSHVGIINTAMNLARAVDAAKSNAVPNGS